MLRGVSGRGSKEENREGGGEPVVSYFRGRIIIQLINWVVTFT